MKSFIATSAKLEDQITGGARNATRSTHQKSCIVIKGDAKKSEKEIGCVQLRRVRMSTGVEVFIAINKDAMKCSQELGTAKTVMFQKTVGRLNRVTSLHFELLVRS